MKSKISEKMVFVCQFEQTKSKSDPLYLLQPNLSQVKVGLTANRQHTFHVWNFLISKITYPVNTGSNLKAAP